MTKYSSNQNAPHEWAALERDLPLNSKKTTHWPLRSLQRHIVRQSSRGVTPGALPHEGGRYYMPQCTGASRAIKISGPSQTTASELLLVKQFSAARDISLLSVSPSLLCLRLQGRSSARKARSFFFGALKITMLLTRHSRQHCRSSICGRRQRRSDSE